MPLDASLPYHVRSIILATHVVENVLEAMVDAVLVVNAEGRITRANHAAADLSGYTASELQGRLIKEMLVDESDGLKTVVRRRIEDGDILRRESSWLVTKDGQRIPVSVTGSPVLTNGGMLEGIVLVARDVRAMRQLLADREAEIARRQQAEAELRAAATSAPALKKRRGPADNMDPDIDL